MVAHQGQQSSNVLDRESELPKTALNALAEILQRAAVSWRQPYTVCYFMRNSKQRATWIPRTMMHNRVTSCLMEVIDSANTVDSQFPVSVNRSENILSLHALQPSKNAVSPLRIGPSFPNHSSQCMRRP